MAMYFTNATITIIELEITSRGKKKGVKIYENEKCFYTENIERDDYVLTINRAGATLPKGNLESIDIDGKVIITEISLNPNKEYRALLTFNSVETKHKVEKFKSFPAIISGYIMYISKDIKTDYYLP